MRLVGIVLIVLMAVSAASSDGYACTPSDGQAERALKPVLDSVAVYMTGLGTGSVAVDFRRGRLVALGSRFSPAPASWGRVDVALTDAEIKQMRDLADCQLLRDLSPQLFWFEVREPMYDETYPDLRLTWSDKHVVYGIRPVSTQRSCAGDWVRELYSRMASLCATMVDIAMKHAKDEKAATVIPSDSDDVKQFWRQLRLARMESMPSTQAQDHPNPK